MIEKLQDVIYEYEKEGAWYSSERLYVPGDMMKEIRDNVIATGDLTDGLDFHGYDVVVDPTIEQPQILPPDIYDLRGDDIFQWDPPLELLKQVVFDAEQRTGQRELSKALTDLFTLRVYMQVEDRYEELDQQKIDWFDLKNVRPRADKPEDDEAVQVKFGMEQPARHPADFDQVADEFCRAIKEKIGSTEQRTITSERRRQYSFPTGTDFVQYTTEKCGTLYIEYGPVCMRRKSDFETPANTIVNYE